MYKEICEAKSSVCMSPHFLSHSCISSPSEQLVDVTPRRAGLSHIIKVFLTDAGGLEGTEMVWSTSTCRPVIFFIVVQSTARLRVLMEVMKGPMIFLCHVFLYSSSANLCLIIHSIYAATSEACVSGTPGRAPECWHWRRIQFG